MSKLYRELLKKHENEGIKPEDDIPPVDDIPKNFFAKVARGDEGDSDLDVQIANYLLQVKARNTAQFPSSALAITILAYENNRPEMNPVRRDYLDSYARYEGRPNAFLKGVRKGVIKHNPVVLDHALNKLRAKDDEQFGRELYEVLTYDTINGTPIVRADGDTLTPAGKVVKERVDYKESRGVRYKRPITKAVDGRVAEEVVNRVLQTVASAATWGDKTWEAFLDCALNRAKFRSYSKAVEALLQAFQSVHADGEGVKGDVFDQSIKQLALF